MTSTHLPARFAVPALLGIALGLGACAREEPPAPAPVALSAQEQACIDRAAAVTAADPAAITVAPTASTKTGETIYTVGANGVSYDCVVGPDLQVSSFSAVTAP